MSYATHADFVIKYDPSLIGRSVDDSGGEQAVQSFIEAYLSQASAFIDSYIGVRYVLPLTSTHDSLRRAAMIIAWHDMEQRRGLTREMQDPEYTAIIQWLEKVKEGDLYLAGETVRTDVSSYLDSETPIYTEDKFKYY